MPLPFFWYNTVHSGGKRSRYPRNRRHQRGVLRVYTRAFLTFVLLGRAIAHRHLLRYNKDNQNQRLNQGREHPQRLSPLPSMLYFYTLSLPSGRVMTILLALRLNRTSEWGPWLLAVLLAAGWCTRASWVPATSPSMTKDAERAKRVERWGRRRSRSEEHTSELQSRE